ncbi:MAG: dTDP-4-amino-4,6-dideoxygalactose transaminase [Saprospiraceae bacterium]
MKIPFNKPFLTGKEAHYLYQAVYSGKLSGNGQFTQKCQQLLEQSYQFKKCLLTTSCTDALEMCAILANIQQGDEVIMPSYTFVSTANAFVSRGAKIVFADSGPRHPNLDPLQLPALITARTKAIVVVHYAGVACNMDPILKIAKAKGIIVIEDAAQAIDSFYKGKPLGSIGSLGTFSFHETKNIIAGEGGALTINEYQFLKRAEIIWEKGTNRAAFFRGEIDKYGWVDVGSSFLPSEVVAGFLFAQLENLHQIQERRILLWNTYYEALRSLSAERYFSLPEIPTYASNNAHIFYLICNSLEERTALIKYLKSQGILAVFHYLSLHSSPYYHDKHDGRELPNSDRFSDCLLRLPMFYELEIEQVLEITQHIKSFYLQHAVPPIHSISIPQSVSRKASH